MDVHGDGQERVLLLAGRVLSEFGGMVSMVSTSARASMGQTGEARAIGVAGRTSALSGGKIGLLRAFSLD